jgi:hypothetical protein
MQAMQKDSQAKDFQSMNQWYSFMKDKLKDTLWAQSPVKLILYIGDYDDELKGIYGKPQYSFPVEAVYVLYKGKVQKTFCDVPDWEKNHVLLYKNVVHRDGKQPKRIIIKPDFRVLYGSLENHDYNLEY